MFWAKMIILASCFLLIVSAGLASDKADSATPYRVKFPVKKHLLNVDLPTEVKAIPPELARQTLLKTPNNPSIN
jgi:hypothetical protein